MLCISTPVRVVTSKIKMADDEETQSNSSSTRRKRNVKSYAPFKMKDTCKNKLNWTTKEKKDLITAVRKHGWRNYSKIEEEVGTKSRVEVARYIELKHQQARHSSAFHRERERTPIELWIDKADKSVRNNTDYSYCLGKVMHLLSRWEPHPNPHMQGEPTFSSIYEYFSQLLKGEPPPNLSPVDSAVVLHMIEILASLLKTVPLDEEMELVKDCEKIGLKTSLEQPDTVESDQSAKKNSPSVGDETNRANREDNSKGSSSQGSSQATPSNSKTLNDNNSFNPFNIPIKALGGTCQKFKSHPIFCTNYT